MTNLIFSGADCVGKTAIVKEFQKRHEVKVFHFYPPPRYMDKYSQPLFQKQNYFLYATYLTKDDNVIFDRFHLGELVYAPLYRLPARRFTKNYISRLEKLIKDYSYLVCVSCDNKELKKRFDNCGIKKKHLLKSQIEFLKEFKKSSLRKIFVNTTKATSYQCYKYIIQKLKKDYNEIYE